MKKHTNISLCIVAGLLISTAGFVGAGEMSDMTKELWGNRERTPANNQQVIKLDNQVTVEGATRAIGTIQYDTGVMTATAGGALADFMVGNQFNTHNTGAPVFASGTVATVQMYRADTAGGTAAYLSIYGPVTGGGAAPKLFTGNLAMAPGMNTLTGFGPIAYTGSSFLAGMWMAGSSADLVALDTNLGPMGAHGCAIDDNFPNPTGIGFQTIGSVNAIVRPTGNIVPVELQQFEIQ